MTQAIVREVTLRGRGHVSGISLHGLGKRSAGRRTRDAAGGHDRPIGPRAGGHVTGPAQTPAAAEVSEYVAGLFVTHVWQRRHAAAAVVDDATEMHAGDLAAGGDQRRAGGRARAVRAVAHGAMFLIGDVAALDGLRVRGAETAEAAGHVAVAPLLQLVERREIL